MTSSFLNVGTYLIIVSTNFTIGIATNIDFAKELKFFVIFKTDASCIISKELITNINLCFPLKPL